MATITVTHERGNDYYVTVDEGTTSSGHVVTVWPSDIARYAPDATPEELLEASFQFLLEREPLLAQRQGLGAAHPLHPRLPTTDVPLQHLGQTISRCAVVPRQAGSHTFRHIRCIGKTPCRPRVDFGHIESSRSALPERHMPPRSGT